MVQGKFEMEGNMKLAVNVDHIATIREARRHTIPEPVLAALLAEQAGAEGIVCHIRSDRRHIKERDLHLLKQTVNTNLNIEMGATDEMKHIAMDIKPDIVSLVPERDEEITTEGGLDVLANEDHLQAPGAQVRVRVRRRLIDGSPDREDRGDQVRVFQKRHHFTHVVQWMEYIPSTRYIRPCFSLTTPKTLTPIGNGMV